jgi:hypothetical protein
MPTCDSCGFSYQDNQSPYCPHHIGGAGLIVGGAVQVANDNHENIAGALTELNGMLMKAFAELPDPSSGRGLIAAAMPGRWANGLTRASS